MNILVIIFLGLMLIKLIAGYHSGMVRQIVSLVSFAILGVVMVIIGLGLSSYTKGKFVNTVIAVLMLAAIAIVHHLLSLIFFSAKIVTKLPMVHWLDKLLGAIMGMLETIVIFWMIYSFVMIFNLGAFEQVIIDFTKNSRILTILYQYNYLAAFIEKVTGSLGFI